MVTVVGAWWVCVALIRMWSNGMPVFALDPPRGAVEDVALDHQHVALDEGDLPPLRVLDHDRRGAEPPLLAGDLVRADPAADDHRVVRDQVDRRRPRLELAGGRAALEGHDEQEHPQKAKHHRADSSKAPAENLGLPLVAGRAGQNRIFTSRRGIATPSISNWPGSDREMGPTP